MRHAVVVGGTGLIGSELLQLLSAAGAGVTALVRTPGRLRGGPGIAERPFAFADPAAYDALGTSALPCDALFCCIGTTMKTAGSKAGFLAVERDIPLRLIAALRQNRPDAVFAFVSSTGAGTPTGFYLRTKREVEDALLASSLPYVIARPSLLLGSRAEFRPGERLAVLTLPPLFKAAEALFGRPQWLGRYRPIPAAQVARAMLQAVASGRTRRILEGSDLYD
jgi:uncharacterized protein YbjT (DUF2867 family)